MFRINISNYREHLPVILGGVFYFVENDSLEWIDRNNETLTGIREEMTGIMKFSPEYGGK